MCIVLVLYWIEKRKVGCYCLCKNLVLDFGIDANEFPFVLNYISDLMSVGFK